MALEDREIADLSWEVPVEMRERLFLEADTAALESR